jgi:hypothetical protein
MPLPPVQKNPISVDWPTVLDTILQVFTQIATDQITLPSGKQDPILAPAWTAEWKGRAGSYTHPGQGFSLFLKVTDIQPLGWDEKNFPTLDTGLAVGDPATDEFNTYQQNSGMRQMNLQVQVESTEDLDDLFAVKVLDRIQTCLGWDSVIDQFLAINVDITDYRVRPIRDVKVAFDNRFLSAASMDVTLTACIISTDPSPTGYVATIVMTSHAQINGVDVPVPLNVLDDDIPPG